MYITEKNKKKYYPFIIALLVVAIVAACVVLYLQHKQSPTPASNKTDGPSTTANNSQTNSANTTQSNNSSVQPAQKQNYVDTPVNNPPSDTSPYPIQNSHYMIEQKSSTAYSVTLYPIVNNANYSDYTSQLKAYKNEVLSYLTQRYGDISKFSIAWSPNDATNL